MSMTGLFSSGLQIAPISIVNDSLDISSFIVLIMSTIGSLLFGRLTYRYSKKAFNLEQQLSTIQQQSEEELLKKQYLQQKVVLLFREDVLRSSCLIARDETKEGLYDIQIFNCLIYKNNNKTDHLGRVVYVYDIANMEIGHYFSTSYFMPEGSNLKSFPTKQSLINAILIKGFHMIDPVLTKSGYKGVLSLIPGWDD